MAVDGALQEAGAEGLLSGPPVWVSSTQVKVHIAGGVQTVPVVLRVE
jgi:hypothetical protein